MIADGTTYSSVDVIGPDALQIWKKVYGFIAPGVPENQWQIEVEGWLKTTLAKRQAYMVEYAVNTAHLGPHGHIGFPVANNTLYEEWKTQCFNQKISNLGAYQNLSVFGFAFTWTANEVIIIISWSLKCFETKQRKLWGCSNQEGPAACRIAWKIDVKFQQQRVALHSVGCRELIGGEDDVPFLEEEGPLRLCPSARVKKSWQGEKRQKPFISGQQRPMGPAEVMKIRMECHTMVQMALVALHALHQLHHHRLNTRVLAAHKSMHKGHNRLQVRNQMLNWIFEVDIHLHRSLSEHLNLRCQRRTPTTIGLRTWIKLPKLSQLFLTIQQRTMDPSRNITLPIPSMAAHLISGVAEVQPPHHSKTTITRPNSQYASQAYL